MKSEMGDCSGRSCDWAMDGVSLGCDTGSGSCFHAFLLDADSSNFHDETLQKATTEIRDILNSIPPDAEGRHLCFVNTRQGCLLAWVSHNAAANFSPEKITIDSGFETIASALQLKS